MKKVCCSNGHYFDSDKFTICPICHPPTREAQNNFQWIDTPQTRSEVAVPENLTKQKRKCPNGHNYDGNRFSACPICDPTSIPQPMANPLSASVQPANHTIPQEVKMDSPGEPSKPVKDDNDKKVEQLTTASESSFFTSKTARMNPPADSNDNEGLDYSVSTPYETSSGTDNSKSPSEPSASRPNSTLPDQTVFPVGWLVGYKGVYRGMFFSCHTGRNSLGNSCAADIDLSRDPAMEDEIQASVIYDPHQRLFFLHAGTGKGLVYLNDTLVFSCDPLEAYDHIQIGNNDLVFIPLCGPQFTWEEV